MRVVRKNNAVRKNEDGLLYCPGCERYLYPDMFYTNSSRTDGKQTYCILCHRYAVANCEGLVLEGPQNPRYGSKSLYEQYFELLDELGYKPVVPIFI